MFWQWDARLTTTALLFVTYIGYLAVRRLGGTHEQRAKRSAVIGMLAVLEIPLVHWSVVIWRSLHQEATVLDTDGDVDMDGMMLFSFSSASSPSRCCTCGWCCTAPGRWRWRTCSTTAASTLRWPNAAPRRVDRGGGTMIALFEDAGFIIGGYVLTFAAVGRSAWRVLGAGKRLGKQVLTTTSTGPERAHHGRR